MREDTRGFRAASGWKGDTDQDSLFWRALCAEQMICTHFAMICSRGAMIYVSCDYVTIAITCKAM